MLAEDGTDGSLTEADSVGAHDDGVMLVEERPDLVSMAVNDVSDRGSTLQRASLLPGRAHDHHADPADLGEASYDAGSA